MSAKERAIAAALCAAMAGSIIFIAAYASSAERLYEGLGLAIAAAGFAAAAVGWGFWLLPQDRVVDERDDYPSSASDREAESAEVGDDIRAVTRRHTLARLLYAALGLFGIALVVPVRSLGNGPDDTLFHTKWRRGSRLVREGGKAVHVSDLQVNSIATVFPEGAYEDAQSQTVLIRLPDDVSDTAQGYVAYSKICTHAGCPVALYRAAARQLMCPCHQSIFDVTGNGAVVSGPADHALPRLPIHVDAEGYVRASDDFSEPVGPGFWERG